MLRPRAVLRARRASEAPRPGRELPAPGAVVLVGWRSDRVGPPDARWTRSLHVDAVTPDSIPKSTSSAIRRFARTGRHAVSAGPQLLLRHRPGSLTHDTQRDVYQSARYRGAGASAGAFRPPDYSACRCMHRSHRARGDWWAARTAMFRSHRADVRRQHDRPACRTPLPGFLGRRRNDVGTTSIFMSTLCPRRGQLHEHGAAIGHDGDGRHPDPQHGRFFSAQRLGHRVPQREVRELRSLRRCRTSSRRYSTTAAQRSSGSRKP